MREARWPLVFAAYFAAQAVLRLLIGPALELDEAEAFFHARTLTWGYGPQPPLYFWVQHGVFAVLGEGLLALAAFKAVLLSAALTLLYLLLRAERPPDEAGPAAMALGLLPQVLWEAQRALANSVLALVLAVAFTILALRALRLGRRRDHLALGVALGLGILAKYNFAVWAAGLLLAAAWLTEWRGGLRPWRLLATGGVGAALVAPFAAWAWQNPGPATESLAKLEIEVAGGPAARLVGISDLAVATLGFLALALLVLAPVAWAVRGRGAPAPGPVARLLGAGALISLGLVAVGVLASGTTAVKDRWLLPFAWPLAPVAMLWLWPRLSPTGRWRLTGGLAALWLLAMATLPYASLVDPGYRGARFAPLAAALRELGAPDLPVVATGTWVAGNLALADPALAPRLWPDAASPLILVGPADAVAEAAETLGGAASDAVEVEVEVAAGRGGRFAMVGARFD